MCIEFTRALLSGAKSVKSKIHMDLGNKTPPWFNNGTSQGALFGPHAEQESSRSKLLIYAHRKGTKQAKKLTTSILPWLSFLMAPRALELSRSLPAPVRFSGWGKKGGSRSISWHA